MKLTQKQITNMTRMAEASEFVGAPVLALLDHIRAVEAERDDWHTMAERLAKGCIHAATDEDFEADDLLAVIADYDALVVREVTK